MLLDRSSPQELIGFELATGVPSTDDIDSEILLNGSSGSFSTPRLPPAFTPAQDFPRQHR
jgi:hypothetical protein